MFRLLTRALDTLAIGVLVLLALAWQYPWWAAAGVAVLCALVLLSRYGARLERERVRTMDLAAMSPLEYEAHCAEVLRAAGWSVRLVGRQGDQGVDVLAELRGTRAAIQCKKYTRRAGNAAVQQIVAGKRHYSAQIAVVACPAGYTSAAQELADSNAVLLLSHGDLSRLETLARVP